MKQKLQEYALVAEIVGAVAIVLSLIFVGTELQRNTSTVRGATFQSVSDSITEFTLSLATTPGLAELYVRGLNNPNELSTEESIRFNMLITTIGRRIESAYIQKESGLLLDSQWAGFRSVCKGALRSEGAISWLEQNPTNYSPEFTEYLRNDCE